MYTAPRKTLSEDDFADIYAPINVAGDTEPTLREFHEIAHANPNRVWTVLESDDDNTYLLPGIHSVKNLGYVLTRKPWVTGSEKAVYSACATA